MRLLLPIHDLQPNMHLAADVMNGIKLLLPKGWQLSRADIEFLRQSVGGQLVPVAAGGLEQGVEFEDESREEKISLQVRRSIAESLRDMRAALQAGSELEAERLAAIQLTLVKMLTYVQANPVRKAILTEQTQDNYLIHHTANVVYLSVILGERLRNYIKLQRQQGCAAQKVSNATSLAPLASGAFFHDVGMIALEELWQRRENLSMQDMKRLQAHPTTGFEMMQEKIPTVARQVVRSHHENWDGSGYPRNLAGDKIHVYARIVRVADAYCAATARKTYRRAQSPAAVLHEMVYGRYRRCYDPTVAEALKGLIQPFAIGSRLKLITGQWVVVVGHHPDEPFRPKVALVFDKQGRILPPSQMEAAFYLSEQLDLKVVSSDTEDLRFLQDENGYKGCDVETNAIEKSEKEMFDLAYP